MCVGTASEPGRHLGDKSLVTNRRTLDRRFPADRQCREDSEERSTDDGEDVGRSVGDELVAFEVGSGDAIAEAVAREANPCPGAARGREIDPESPIRIARSGDVFACAIRCRNPDGSGFRGNGPSPPMTHRKRSITPSPSRIFRVGIAGLLVSTASCASSRSRSIVSAMPS